MRFPISKGVIIFEEVMTVVEEVTREFSIMEYTEVEDGVYESSVLIISAFNISGTLSFLPSKLWSSILFSSEY